MSNHDIDREALRSFMEEQIAANVEYIKTESNDHIKGIYRGRIQGIEIVRKYLERI